MDIENEKKSRSVSSLPRAGQLWNHHIQHQVPKQQAFPQISTIHRPFCSNLLLLLFFFGVSSELSSQFFAAKTAAFFGEVIFPEVAQVQFSYCEQCITDFLQYQNLWFESSLSNNMAMVEERIAENFEEDFGSIFSPFNLTEIKKRRCIFVSWCFNTEELASFFRWQPSLFEPILTFFLEVTCTNDLETSSCHSLEGCAIFFLSHIFHTHHRNAELQAACNSKVHHDCSSLAVSVQSYRRKKDENGEHFIVTSCFFFSPLLINLFSISRTSLFLAHSLECGMFWWVFFRASFSEFGGVAAVHLVFYIWQGGRYFSQLECRWGKLRCASLWKTTNDFHLCRQSIIWSPMWRNSGGRVLTNTSSECHCCI